MNEVSPLHERAETRRAARRAQILRAARDAFAELGYHGATVADVIERADIARGTFYLYFDGKEALFLELLDGLFAELAESVIGVDTTPGSPPLDEQLRDTVRRILVAIDGNRALASIVFREAVVVDPAVATKLRAFYERLHAFIEVSLRNGCALGYVRDLDAHFTASCILGSIKQVVEQHIVMERATPLDLDRVTNAIVDYNLRGVAR